jgi:hypothetical protein
MKAINFILLLISTLHAVGQITFEKIYPNYLNSKSVVELSDHSFALCATDSLQRGFILRLDQIGSQISSYMPMLRNNSVNVQDITIDHSTGGYAICGSSSDTASTPATGFYLLLDSGYQQTDSLFFSGGNNGPDAIIILPTTNNNFIIGTNEFLGAGHSATIAQKINYPSNATWNVTVGSDISTNGLALDSSNRLIATTFNWVGAASAGISLYDTGGVLLKNYGITDTAYGGSLIFQAYCAPSADSNYLFGVDLTPNTGGGSVVYLAKLDTAFQVIWDKYLDWSTGASLNAITPTADNGIAIMLTTDSGLTIHKLNSVGDSLWTEYHHRAISGFGTRFRQCADGGFIIAGTFYDSLSSKAYVLKTDSLGRLLPPANITIGGSTIICPGDSVQLFAAPGYTYLWSDSSVSSIIWAYGGQNYYVTVTDSTGLSASSDTVSIELFSTHVPVITPAGNQLNATGSGNFQWYLNGIMILGADSSSFGPVHDGDYIVQLTDTNGCVTTSNVYIITSIEEISDNITILNQQNILSINANENITQVILYDISGKVLLTASPDYTNYSFNKNTLSQGSYIICIKTNSGREIKRMFVK